MNPDYCKQALEKVGNPNILVNLISRRVKQLNSGGGASSRPLLLEHASLGDADIALIELIEDKMGWEAVDPIVEDKTEPRKRKKS